LQKPRTVDVWDHGEDHADTREKPQEPVGRVSWVTTSYIP
jgi:hypothetical protein